MSEIKKKLTVGIIGGMGPEATVDIFQKIVKMTSASKDEEHLRILIDNNPMVPSRIKAILENGETPLPVLIRMAENLEKMGADFLIIPCNTASFYIDDLRKKVMVPILSIVEETANFLEVEKPSLKKVGILATEATLKVGLYQKELFKKKLETIQITGYERLINNLMEEVKKRYWSLLSLKLIESEQVRVVFGKNDAKTFFSILTPYMKSLQKWVMKAIFGRKGIKAGYSDYPRKLLVKAVAELQKKGAQVIIMGCTEIPLVLRQKDVKIELIDPAKILAKSVIDYAFREKGF